MTLNEFFQKNPKAALAFSGGVDSAYLLYFARQCGAEVQAYYVQSAFQPQFERADAERLTVLLGATMRVLEVDVLSVPQVAANPPDRCYHCKWAIFETIAKTAAADGYALVLDGTNASDDAGDRPGMRALQELTVRSPLRECGLAKDVIRRLSKEAGLFTGEAITAEKLQKTEAAEDYLFSLGLTDFRVRLLDGCARIQVPEAQLPQVLEKRREILNTLRKTHSGVLLDLEARG